jgi:hypothetical protein
MAQYTLTAVLALMTASPGAAAAASPTVQVDNDLFAPTNEDRDYTGGVSISMRLDGQPRGWHPDTLLGGFLSERGDAELRRSLQLRVMAFTPGTLSMHDVDRSDRPYASLWSLTGARLHVHDDSEASSFAAVTVGVLGLPATASLHRAVHEQTGAVVPAGYRHQVSAGGEPTARLTLAHRRRVHGGAPQHGSDLWITFAGSLGYLTEASVALAGRSGTAVGPWWLSNADLADYGAAPQFGEAGPGLQFEYGAKLRLHAYNAFVQGQWRRSDHTLDGGEVARLIGEAWLGANLGWAGGWRLGARLTTQSGEARRGPAAQRHIWGSISLTRQW